MDQHPRPSLRRAWASLDGTWEFRGPGGEWRDITVPFAPETAASGIAATGFVDECWYRRRVDIEAEGTVLHFGAVDRVATVQIDGAPVATHEGGYTPFSVPIPEGEHDIGVHVWDDHADLEAPRGKQEWLEKPHSIFYPRTTGIWRSVWTERVPARSIESVEWQGDPRSLTLRLRARVTGGSTLVVRVRAGERLLIDDRIGIRGATVERSFSAGAGLDDRLALTWWPRRPTLLATELALLDADGGVLDEVRCEAAFRSATVDDGVFLLNGRPFPLRFALDQGYWPTSGLTPPGLGALQHDLELVRALGLNGVRKHQKVEDPRFLALADRLGILVWVEMPSAYQPGPTATARLLREWASVVEGARHHPSVVGYVPLNESWGVSDLERDPQQRALLEALTASTRALDGTRPVSANDGWETAGGDVVGIHDYTQDAAVLRDRYGSRDAVAATIRERRSDGRLVDLDRRDAGRRAVVLSEFGGVALHGEEDADAWGYERARDGADLLRRLAEQWQVVRESDGLAGGCWTQLTDTYQEVNGLVRFDRTPKAPVEEIARAIRGR